MQKLSFPTRKLKGLIKRVNVKYKNSDGFEEVKLKVYGVTNVDGITITGNNASEDLSNYLILKENQFAYNPYRINVGSLGLAKKEFLGLVSPAYVVFETKKGLDKDFLFYYLKSNLGLNLIKWYGDRGGVRSALRYSDLENIDIPDLDINQQRQVLEKLKNVDVLLNEYNSSYNKQIKYIKKVRDSILQDALQGKLVPQDPNDEVAEILLEKIREEKERLVKERKIKKEKNIEPFEKKFDIPNSWRWIRLREIIYDITYGTSNKCDYNFEGTAILRIPNVSNGYLQLDDIKYTILSDNDLNRLSLKKGDLLIIRSNGSSEIVGKSTLISNDLKNYSFAGYLIRIRMNNNYINSEYINKVLNSKLVRSQIEPSLRTTTGVKNVNSNEIGNLIIPIPPLDEQKHIVEKVDSLMVLCDQLEKKIQKQKDYSNRLMESILKNSF